MNAKTNFEARAAAQPTELHKAFADWIYVQTGIRPDLKAVQLACIFRMDYQRSEDNQKALAERKAKAAAAKKASAARKAAKLKEAIDSISRANEKAEADKVGETIYREAFDKARALGEDHGEATRQGGEARARWQREQDAAKAEKPLPKHKVTIVYGSGEPQVHAAGCADLKKLTSRQGYSRETRMVATHTELTEIIYDDMIDSGESTLEENYRAYNDKPCCPILGA